MLSLASTRATKIWQLPMRELLFCGNFLQSGYRAREAKKVFLGFLNPFSSEKGFKPPEALERSVKTGAKRQIIKKDDLVN